MRRLSAAVASLAALVLVGGSATASQRPRALPPLPAGLPLLSPPQPPPDPPAKPAPAQEEFGVNVNRVFNDGRYSPSQIDAQLEAVQATGATVARSDAFWAAAEPGAPQASRHRFDWSSDDEIASALAAHGLRWLPVLDYSPEWAESVVGDGHSSPRAPVQFATFAGAFAARYGTGGVFWRQHPALPALPVETYEIWNEPDNDVFWRPAPAPSMYGRLYRLSRNAVIASDPAARVVIGGLTHPETFLPELIQAHPELVGHIDGVAIHPYAPRPSAVLEEVRTARSTMDQLGLSTVPLYVTEFGWTTHPRSAADWAPAKARRRYITRTFAAFGHTDCGIAAALLYTWTTPQRNRRDPEDWYGIHPPRRGTNRDTKAFTTALREAAAPAPTLAVCAGS